MPEYSVCWHMDLTANTPVLAATEALEIHRDPESLATAFRVRDEHGSIYHVDLGDERPVPVVIHTPPLTPRRWCAAWFSGRLVAWAAALDATPRVA
ncbi:hypothetical protein [Nocardia sp. XZ_19_369]|uniref:hypothetical protein n=1 Tax=Nocardia sp. XZ_19_369 TaxID=2769487 RepID=UPI00188ECC78|nr:hypothetical protein [Nocardia sp. XZ_19_369]